MARPLRIEYEGAFYHVTSRGNERKKIFYSKYDYEKFKSYLKETQEKYGYFLHAYVLMGNHFHLLIETPEANLSQIMHYINGAYTNYINRRKKRSGHLFQGRYKAILVDRDNYLLELSRYIHLNPVRANIVEAPQHYPFSSYRSYISRKGEEILYRELILKMISKNQKEAPKRYREFVERGIGQDLENPLKGVYGGSILGEKGFIKEALSRLQDTMIRKDDISYRRALQTSHSFQDVMDIVRKHFKIKPDDMKEMKGVQRNIAVHLLKKHTGMTNRQIGEYFGALSYSAVAKIQTGILDKARRDRKLMKTINRMSNEISNFKG